jgi:hypothetical protein
MRKRERGLVLLFRGKIGKDADHGDKTVADEPQSLRHHDEVGVVAHIARGRAEMDDRFRLRALDAVGVNVRHHVVADDLFPRLGDLVVDIVLMRFHFGDLLIRDGQAELLLRFRQRNPEAAPGAEFPVRRK